MSDELDALRVKIDEIDAGLIALLGERFKLTRRVGQLKASSGLASLDTTRENAQNERFAQLAKAADVDGELVQRVFDEVRAAVRAEHEMVDGRAQSHPSVNH